MYQKPLVNYTFYGDKYIYRLGYPYRRQGLAFHEIQPSMDIWVFESAVNVLGASMGVSKINDDSWVIP